MHSRKLIIPAVAVFMLAILAGTFWLIWGFVDGHDVDGGNGDRRSAQRTSNGHGTPSATADLAGSISTADGLRREGKARLGKLQDKMPGDRTESEIMIAIELGAGEDFEEIWELVETSALDADARCRLLSHLCTWFPEKVGFGVVLNKVVGLSESGEWKNQLITATFFGARDAISTMLSNASGLEYPDERAAALEGISRRINALHLEDIDFSGFARLGSKDEAKIIGAALGERIRNADRNRKTEEFDVTLRGIRQLIVSGKADDSILGGFLSAAADTSPLDAWRVWMEMPHDHLDGNDGPYSKVPQRLVDGLVKIGGEVAMENLVVPDLSKRPEDARLSGLAFYRWLSKDVNGATAWLSSPVAGFGGLQADYVYQATVQYNLEHGQFDAAKEWALKIGDGTIRDATLGGIAARVQKGEQK